LTPPPPSAYIEHMLRAVAQIRVAATAEAVAGPGACPHAVPHPLMDQDWLGLSFLHWRYPPETVQRLLPQGMRVDTFDGDAWVALVPFLLRVRVPNGPALPWLGVFPETNVRTYVRGPDGKQGIWFFSLEAPRRLAIWAARAWFHLPYRVAAMEMRCSDSERTYTSWRLESPHRGVSSRARIIPGEYLAPEAVTPLEHFLTARWRLYALLRNGIGTARVEHPPWRIARATAHDVDTHLLTAAGLPHPEAAPLAHACGDVRASLTRLTRCPRTA